MRNERKITAGLTISGQPTEEEMKGLTSRGFRTLVNLRTTTEDGALPDEERIAESSGLNYAAIPMTTEDMDDIAMHRFTQTLDSVHGQPAVIHCGSGGRAGIMALLYLAIKHGWSVKRAIEEGERLGDLAPSERSKWRPFFEGYIKRHSAGERS